MFFDRTVRTAFTVGAHPVGDALGARGSDLMRTFTDYMDTHAAASTDATSWRY